MGRGAFLWRRTAWGGCASCKKICRHLLHARASRSRPKVQRFDHYKINALGMNNAKALKFTLRGIKVEKFTRKLILTALCCGLCVGAAQASALYNFGYTFTGVPVGAGTTVSGSFFGDANGNLITNLSNISVAVNGVNFVGSGSLFGSSFDPVLGWRTGGAVVSFDGTQNNFLFVDTNYPDDPNMWVNYIYGIADFAQVTTYSFATGVSASDFNLPMTNWSVTPAANVPEPESLLLLGLSLGCLYATRRKKSMVK